MSHTLDLRGGQIEASWHEHVFKNQENGRRKVGQGGHLERTMKKQDSLGKIRGGPASMCDQWISSATRQGGDSLFRYGTDERL